MRTEPTDAERRLWSHLRQKQVAGYRFRRQYPLAGYIVDFYCVPARLAVELDGGQHTEPEAIDYDQKRDAMLQSLGVRIMRFSNVEVLRDTHAVVEAIYAALTAERPPLPSP